MWNEIQAKREQLGLALAKLQKNGTALAEAERNYKEVLAKTVLKLRDAGTPATLINLVIYGDNEVSIERLKRDIAEVNYDTNKEFINVLKLELKLLEAQMEREWHG